MVSVPTAVYQGIRQYLLPDHDPVTVAVKIATVIATHRETVPLSTVSETMSSSTEGADEWPPEQTASEQSVASGTPKDAPNASASDTDGPVPVAQDTPVKDMPLTASGRANLRLGRTKDGKGRP